MERGTGLKLRVSFLWDGKGDGVEIARFFPFRMERGTGLKLRVSFLLNKSDHLWEIL